jgi:tRNA(Ile)-lysidine synthase
MVIDAAALRQMPYAMARRVARQAIVEAANGRFVGLEHAERLVELAVRGRPGRVLLPGLQAELSGRGLALRPRTGRAAASPHGRSSSSGNSFRAALSIPGEALLEDGRRVSSDVRPAPSAGGETVKLTDPLTAVVDAGLIKSLAVRHGRPGDRFPPLGMKGRKKLQDFFVDRKVPREERRRVPLVVDGDDRIVWVAGHAVSEDFRVSGATRAVVILKLRGERV